MKQFKLINNVVGWIVFAIAAYTYCATVEPSASFWDCPEFIATADKLDVGHPPGAPFFMLTGCPHGKHHVCPAECTLHPVFVLECHTFSPEVAM